MNDKHKAPDANAWLALHGDYLHKYAVLRLRDAAAAEDVVQETLLAALTAYSNFAGRGSERTWLIAILKHKLADHFRRAVREFPVGEESEETPSGEWFKTAAQASGSWNPHYAPTDWHSTPAELAERRDFWYVFNDCLSHLPKRTASAFALREVDGLDSREICELLSISMTHLWVILHRARLHLRHCLEMAWFKRSA